MNLMNQEFPLKTSRRRLCQGAATLTALVILTALGSPTAAFAQDPGAPQQPAGSWVYTVTIPDGTASPIVFQGLETYIPGGGYVETDQLSFMPASLSTPSHGSWATTGKSTFLLTYFNFSYDNTGTSQGGSRIRQIATLGADGNSYSGSGDFYYYDTNGNVVLSGTFTIRATRIPVEAPAGTTTPVAPGKRCGQGPCRNH